MVELRLLHFLVLAFAIIAALIPWGWKDRLQVKFPLNSKYTKQADEIYTTIRVRSSIEHFPMSYEIISDAQFTAYIEKLLQQHQNSPSAIREYIERIPLTEQGQQFFRTVSIGWHNSISITLIAYKKFNGHHKIVIATLSKRVTLSLFSKLLSPFSSLLGRPLVEHQQLEKLMTNLNREENKQIMENTMMLIMGNSLRERYNDVLDIDFVQ